MDPKVPLGERESSVLEFKAADSLKNPFKLSREIVAFLNTPAGTGAAPGQLWIGLREEKGRAVAVDPIPDAENARGRLLDHLVEAIEPRLLFDLDRDLSIQVVEFEGNTLLLVTVRRPGIASGAYAQLKNSGRYFYVRIDDRVRPMTYQELFPSEPSMAVLSAPSRLHELRDTALTGMDAGLWMGIEIQGPLKVDVQAEFLTGLLSDPTKSGNQNSGRNFAIPPSAGLSPELSAGRVKLGSKKYRATTVWKTGLIEFQVGMDSLRQPTETGMEIRPLALLEYLVSVARLAKTIYEAVPEGKVGESMVWFDVIFLGLEGWSLPAFAPGTYGYNFKHEAPKELDGGQILLSSPLRIPLSEFTASPDYAGFLLTREIFEAFGLRAERIPEEYDPASRRLRFQGH